ncbi:MAG: hypothetical protein DWQ07_22020 [Chloroflexi bacterium]|nr:MAG: hypothetical protein DWQ07_22020 [Chloroflexota bacterium]MBL1196368.1 hypothetical protein [Chloroflexota bacterium]NOH13663.1 Ig-like domain-containing protein [Chloroflexota bacterium]
MMRSTTWFYVVLSCLLLVACGAGGNGPQAWIDQPLDGTNLPVDTAITIQAHASDDQGVASFEFSLDEQVLNTVNAAGTRLGDAAMEWTPQEPGTYLIKVRAFDGEGNPGPYSIKEVNVLGMQAFAELPPEDPLFLEPTPPTVAQAAETTFARINHVECGENGVVYADITIGDPAGIQAYALFSTVVEAVTSEEFVQPYPTFIDKRVQLTEPSDAIDRDHQIGLEVQFATSEPGSSTVTYALEPQGRCPGHYEPVLGDPGSTFPLITARQNSNCRAGTSSQFEVLGFLLADQSASIEGRDNLNQWLLITAPDTGKACWIAASLGDIEGDLDDVAILATPEPPVVTATEESPPDANQPPPDPNNPPPSGPDTTPPVIQSTDVSPTSILTDSTGCPSYSRTTLVTATVTDDVGISSVVASWGVGGESGQVNLTSAGGNSYEGQIGPVNSTGTMTITIVVQDAAGNNAQTGALSVDVQNCIN